MSIDENHTIVEANPVRNVQFHLNLVTFLENAPCINCLKVKNIQFISSDKLQADLVINNPFVDKLNFTGFDVRGIFISAGDFEFPLTGRNVAMTGTSFKMLNQDGYTSIFNPTEFPDGPGPDIFTYYKGKFATNGVFSSTLMPYVAYEWSKPRRMFLPGVESTRTVILQLPAGPLQFGYAVDCSWAPAGKPVVDPETDFPIEANCYEAYKIEVDSVDSIYDEAGSTGDISVTVYDHQGLETIEKVEVEVQGLMSSLASLSFSTTAPDGGHTFSGTITNQSGAAIGDYPLLVKVTDSISDPNLGELAAYGLSEVSVAATPKSDPVAIGKADQVAVLPGVEINFQDDGSYDPDGGDIVKYEWDWESDGTYDTEGAEVTHSWSTPGNYDVQLRVTDDENATDTLDEAIQIEISTIYDPVAYAHIYPLTQSAGYMIQFDDAWSYDPDGGAISSHEWDFDNDGIYDEMGKYTSHIFDTEGVYEVQMRVTDDEGVTDELDEPVEVWIYPDNVPSPVDITPDGLNVKMHSYAVDGDYLYVSSGPYMSQLNIFDISDLSNPLFVKAVDGMTEDSTFGQVIVENGYAAVSDATNGVLFYDVDLPEDAAFINFVAYPGEVFMGFHNGYLFVSYNQRVDIFDVDPIEEFNFVKSIFNITQGYPAFDGNYAYIYGIDNHISVINISSIGGSFKSGEFELPVSAQGISYDVVDGYAYVIFEQSEEVGMKIYDVSLPLNWVLVGQLTNVNWVHDLMVIGDVCILAGQDVVSVDISDKANPTVINTVAEDEIFDYIRSDGSKAVLSGREDSFTTFDFSDPGSPVENQFYPTINRVENVLSEKDRCVLNGNDTNDLKFSTIDADGIPAIYYSDRAVAMPDAEISGDYLLTGSDFALDNIDVFELANPENKWTFNTPEFIQMVRMETAGRYVFISDAFNIYVYENNIPGSLDYVTTILPGVIHNDFKVTQGHLLLHSLTHLDIYSIEDISSPELADSLDIPDVNSSRLMLSGGYVYTYPWITDATTVYVIDIFPVSEAGHVSTISVMDSGTELDVQGRYHYLFDDTGRLRIFDMVDPANPASIFEETNSPEWNGSTAVENNHLYLSQDYYGVKIFEL